MDASNWKDAMAVRERELVQRVIEETIRYYMTFGIWPTVQQMAEAIGLEPPASGSDRGPPDPV